MGLGMIEPIIFKFWHVEVTYYALVYVAGFVTCLIVLLRASRTGKLKLSEGEVYDLLLLMVMGLLVGARVFHFIFWDLAYFLSDPLEIFRIWNGGMSFYGGLAGASLVSWAYLRRKRISWLAVADILIVPGMLFMGLARLANYLNQEIVGTVTDSSWCVVFEGSLGCRHPVQLYAAVGKFALFGFLLWVRKTRAAKRDGFVFLLGLLFLGLGRFMLDFIREDARWLALSAGQWLSIVMIVIVVAVLWKKKYVRVR